MKYILLFLAISILLRVVVRYILPVFRLTSMASDQMRKMQDQMNEMNRRQQDQPQNRTKGKKEGDYIDYEEVR